MMKSKRKSVFIRDVMCPQCSCKGSMQILSFKQKNDKIEIGNSNRIRHYTKLVNGKAQFIYHSVSREFAMETLANLKVKPDQSDHTNQINHDRNVNESSLKSKDESRGSLAWFGRQTHNLENERGKRLTVQRSRARIPPPAPRTFSFRKENVH